MVELEKLTQIEWLPQLERRCGERLTSDKFDIVGKIKTLVIGDNEDVDKEIQKRQWQIPRGANAYVVSEKNDETTMTTPNAAGQQYHTRHSVYAVQFYKIK